MNDKLIPNISYENEEHLINEVRKMSYVKYSNFLISFTRFILMFFLIPLLLYFPKAFEPHLINVLVFLFIMLIMPLITIFLFIVIITGTIQRDFWIKKNSFKCNFYSCLCCCCIMSKNVNFLKRITFISTFFDFYFLFILLYYYIKDSYVPNNKLFFPFSDERVLERIILRSIDSLLLLSQFYCFYYYNYFLNRIEKYIEFYKRLIIKNKNKEADFIRNTLPYDIESYVSSNGIELRNI